MSMVSAMFFGIISIFIKACANTSADVIAQATRSADSSEARLHAISACLIGFIATLPTIPTSESEKDSPNEKIALASV